MKLFLLIISMEGNKETISVLAVVASSPENFAKRLAIRQTWKNQLIVRYNIRKGHNTHFFSELMNYH